MKLDLIFTDAKNDNTCPKCNTRLLRVYHPSFWYVDTTDNDDLPPETESTGIAITGHWCINCNEIMSMQIRSKK